jgi:hypothetical protein
MCEAGVNAPSCQMPGRDARSRDAEMAVAEMGGMLCDWPWGEAWTIAQRRTSIGISQ